jgi:hypothetical protein
MKHISPAQFVKNNLFRFMSSHAVQKKKKGSRGEFAYRAVVYCQLV